MVNLRLIEEERLRARFAANLRRRREAIGMTKTELHNRAGLTNWKLRAYEDGQNLPSLTTAYVLARELGCTIDELFRDNSGVEEVKTQEETRV